MRRRGWKNVALVGALLGSAAAVLSPLPAVGQIPNVTATTTIASAGEDLELRGVTVSPDGRDVWAALAARPQGRRTATESLWLARVNASGEVAKSQITIPGVGAEPQVAGQPVRQRLLQGLAFDSEGRLVLAVARGTSPPALIPVDAATRSLAAARALTFDPVDTDLTDVVRDAKGRMLVFGSGGGGTLVAEANTAGKLLWQKALPEPGVVVEMAEPAADGTVTVLARKGAAGDAPAMLWVARLSAKGDVEARTMLPGRNGAVTRLRDGGYALASEQSADRGFDVFLRVLGPDLRERWMKPVATGQVSVPGLRVAGMPDGGFLLVGTKDRGLLVTRYSADGTVVWTEARVPAPPTLDVVANLDLIVRGSTCFVPYTAFTVEGREQRQVIRIVKFEVR